MQRHSAYTAASELCMQRLARGGFPESVGFSIQQTLLFLSESKAQCCLSSLVPFCGGDLCQSY